MIKICIFDLDGTLTESQASIARPVNMTLRHFGFEDQPVSAFNYFAGDGLRKSLERALRAAGDTDVETHLEEGFPLCKQWMEEYPLYQVKPYPHMVEALNELKADGIRIAVLSNKLQKAAVNLIETVFGEGVFDHVQGQADGLPIKPDPAGLYAILDKFGLEKPECLYFGDTNTDMLTAHNAGVTAVGVSWGFRPRSELEEYGADIIIDDPAEIPALARSAGQGCDKEE